DGTDVVVAFTVYNGTSGARVDSSGYEAATEPTFTVGPTNTIPGLYKAIHCSTAGSRVVAVVPPVDAFGTAGSSSLGIAPTDTIVFVIDLVSVKKLTVLSKPDSTFPAVKFDSKGVPTLSKPVGDPPAELKIAYLKKGSGATVKAGDKVKVNYQGSLWSTGAVFDSSWARGAATSFTTTQVVTGFGKALVGQKVGSRVIAIITPSEGYGPSGNTAIGLTGTDDMVFVIDIISTAKS
ncbi:MAG: peptidylprolyl isomerase, partial [Microbacteriaceae bacterium]|nr:peptidylprolyl isomerase [Microbacteriaceae bacterium]